MDNQKGAGTSGSTRATELAIEDEETAMDLTQAMLERVGYGVLKSALDQILR